MVIVPDVRQARAFVVVINKTCIHNENLFNSIVNKCRFAQVTDKMMYVVVEEGASLGVLNDMPWRKIFRFADKSDVPKIMGFIDNEVTGGALYT